MKNKLTEKDLELLQVKGKREIDPSNPEFAYLYPRFDASVEGNERDYVEAHIFDTNENFLESATVDRKYIDKDINNFIKIKTGTFLRKIGYDRGRYVVKYNFFRKMAGDYKPILVDVSGNIFNELIDSGPDGNVTIQSDGRIFTTGDIKKELFLRENKYFIHEISESRKEVRLAAQQIKSDKYLRDFFNLQKEKKRIGSVGEIDSHLVFEAPVGTPGASKADSNTLVLANPNGNEFPKHLVGGIFEVSNAFITSFEPAKIQLDDPGFGGGPDEEVHPDDPDVFVPSFLLNTDDTEGGAIKNVKNRKFVSHKNLIKAGMTKVNILGLNKEVKIPGIDELIEISKNQLVIERGGDSGRLLLASTFGKHSLKALKNMKITLSSNSILRDVGRKYRWLIQGVERTRDHETTLGVKHSYHWDWTYLTKSQVLIETPNGGTVNGLEFTGTQDQAKDITFTILAKGCYLDILLEIELEAGERFTEKIFIPRAITTQAYHPSD